MGRRLVVFDALMLRALLISEIDDDEGLSDQIAAFRVAFRGRRFMMLITEGILNQYQIEANKFPPFPARVRLNNLRRQGRVVYVDEYRLNRPNISLTGFSQEHREFILDAIAAGASYLVTNRQAWLNLYEQAVRYGLQIVSPGRFVELAG